MCPWVSGLLRHLHAFMMLLSLLGYVTVRVFFMFGPVVNPVPIEESARIRTKQARCRCSAVVLVREDCTRQDRGIFEEASVLRSFLRHSSRRQRDDDIVTAFLPFCDAR